MVLATSELLKISHNITALNDYNIQGASIDLSIGEKAQVRAHLDTIDLFKADEKDLLKGFYKEVDLAKGYELEPLNYLYASTAEKVKIPQNTCALCVPRSSFARIGLILPLSLYANPGYEGHLPIVIFNASGSRVKIPPYFRIMQLIFLELKGEAKAYASSSGAKYQGENPLKEPIFNDAEMQDILKKISDYNASHN